MLGGRWDVNEAAFTYLAVLSWLVRNISCSGYFSTASLISCLSISVSQHFVCMYVCVCLCACACVRPCCSFLYKILTLFISMLQLKPSAYDWLSATPTKCPSNTEINWEANVFWKGVVLHTGVCVCVNACVHMAYVFATCFSDAFASNSLSNMHARTLNPNNHVTSMLHRTGWFKPLSVPDSNAPAPQYIFSLRWYTFFQFNGGGKPQFLHRHTSITP